MLNVRQSESARLALWAALAALVAVVTFLAFRGYLSGDLLFNFSGAFTC